MLKETVYSPVERFKEITSFRQMFHDLYDARFLGTQLFKRDFSGMFRQSFLGIIWAFIPPFFSAAAWILMQSSGAVKIAPTSIPYPIFVLCGTLLFQTFTEAINAPSQAVQADRGMMAKLKFPREAFLINAFLKLLLNFLLKLIALLVIAIFLRVNFNLNSFLFPMGVLSIMVSGMAIGIILVPFQMLFEDFGRTIWIGGQVLMYLTPVVYPVPKSGFLRTIMDYNPLTQFIIIPRNLFSGILAGDFALYFFLIALSIVITFLGWVIYRATMPIIIERIGA